MSKVLVELPAGVSDATHLRGTVVVTSLGEVRRAGLEERYWRSLPEPRHETIRLLVPQTWLPMELAYAHYDALDRLGLPYPRMIEIGAAAGDRLHKTFIGTLARSMRAAGTLSPLTVLGRMDTIWDRLVRGGGVRVVQLGPKEARVEFHACRLARLGYVRAGWAGMFQAGLGLFAKQIFVRELAQPQPEQVRYQLSWV